VTVAKQLAGFGTSQARRCQRDLRIDADREALFLLPNRYLRRQYFDPLAVSRYMPMPSA